MAAPDGAAEAKGLEGLRGPASCDDARGGPFEGQR